VLPFLLKEFQALARYRGFSAQLPARNERVLVGGLPGGSRAVLVASLAEEFPLRTFLVVASGPSEAERWFSDLNVLTGDAVRLYPQREGFGEEEPHLEITGERTETIEALSQTSVRIVVTSIRATAERTSMPHAVVRGRLRLAKGDDRRPSEVIEILERLGYERHPTVLDAGQFAVRGGLVDLYGFGMVAPMRIEWWGDEIISIRRFDLDTQRSEGEEGLVTILPMRPFDLSDADLEGDEFENEKNRQTILDLMPPDTLLFLDEGVNEKEIETVWSEAEHHLEVARRLGEEVSSRESLWMSPDVWQSTLAAFGSVLFERQPCDFDFRFEIPPSVDRNIKRLRSIADGTKTVVLCDNEGQLERLEELLGGDDGMKTLPAGLVLAIGSLHGGFTMSGVNVLTDHEIFRRARRIRRPRRYRQAMAHGVGIFSPGEYVVHMEHGIGLYRGTEVLSTDQGSIEVAVLEYEGGDRLNIPVYKLDQIERYRSAGEAASEKPPKLHRLGGARWRKQREKTETAIREMAAELLELYARRSVADGFAFPPDGRWQFELESAFLYEDTPDQRTATETVKLSMERPSPMDCLIVGDVGYGKTEVAIRAAFKAAAAGKQVAVLVPTTILAEQHARTFSDRLADFPVVIEVLSRFRTAADQRRVVKAVEEGGVDVLIGTHRLLSKDVKFKDLGLLVVDEEHRFGVKHKERLKELKLAVDVLTLTATPIPRTLHLAMAGLRDLVLIQTPPRDRSPVLTYLEPWDDEVLAEAVHRELDRGGQVFFVHNRIETIETVAAKIQGLAPNARVRVGHGQMKEQELDEVMRAFGDGAVDILVSTMIVESGLDVPNANTMIVHHAEQFGLAQLYQLRGRVGRGHRRAYCYLVVPDTVDEVAEQRLRLLEHHTELGAGYVLALRDLELRGAGNFLGAEQSGHAHAVGFDLYLRWLADAVRSLQEQGEVEVLPMPDVTVDGSAHISDRYIPDEHAKLDYYRRLARAEEQSEILDMLEEMRDRFGPEPAEVRRLLTVFELRLLGRRLGLMTMAVRGDEARLKFRGEVIPRMADLNVALDGVQFAAEVRQVHPLSLRLKRLGGLAMEAGLVRALGEAVSALDGNKN